MEMVQVNGAGNTTEENTFSLIRGHWLLSAVTKSSVLRIFGRRMTVVFVCSITDEFQTKFCSTTEF